MNTVNETLNGYRETARYGKLQILREQYPKGMRVELVGMDDFQAPPEGTRGTVVGVDDAGQIMVNWDNGSSLSLIPGVDSFKTVEKTDGD